MIVKGCVKRGEYFDSVSLMRAAREIAGMEGAVDAALVMGTQENLAILENSGMRCSDFEGVQDTDLLLAVAAADEATALRLLDQAEAHLKSLKTRKSASSTLRPSSLESALQSLPGANLALISVAGRYAGDLARQALNQGLHVMLFSDNVPLEQEIQLKRLGAKQGLLVMGPDCGTAILNGVPLGFANAVARGPVGAVAAAGTGLQEVTSLVDFFGSGISQAIGTGGRDVKAEVGGIMFLEGIRALLADEATQVLLLVSKPPHPSVLEKIGAALQEAQKPVVTVFLGASSEALKEVPGLHARTLEEGAWLAVRLAEGGDASGALEECRTASEMRRPEAAHQATEIARSLAPGRRYLRGLYSGGTFCYEAQILLRARGLELHSNAPTAGSQSLVNVLESVGHTVIDLGEDEFTVGRPHPMIDYSLRMRRLLEEAEDPETAVILLDVVLGYGSHLDPLSEICPVLERISGIPVICCVTGTETDPQVRSKVVSGLEASGARVFPSHAAACEMAGAILGCLEG